MEGAAIIVALNGTRPTEQILSLAKDMARFYGATMVLVRALERRGLPADEDPISAANTALLESPTMDSVGDPDLPSIGMRPGDHLRPARPIDNPEAAGYLNILDNELEAAGYTVEHVDPDDDPADAIINEARSRGARLIVMGTHQHKGWDRLFKGSIAEKVLRESPCPVLVVPID